MTAKGYDAKYLGGHQMFPKSRKCHLLINPDSIEIPELPLTIPHTGIKNVQSQTAEEMEKRRAALGLLLFGPAGLIAGALWKKKKLYMALTYEDEAGLSYDMLFDVKKD